MSGVWLIRRAVVLALVGIFAGPLPAQSPSLQSQVAAYWKLRRQDASGQLSAAHTLGARDDMDHLPGGKLGPPLPSVLGQTLVPPPAAPAGPFVPQVAQPPTIDPWTSLGPGNLGGRTRALMAVTATELYAGAATGGVWKSTDGGTSWVPKSDFIASLGITTLAFDFLTPTILYAGTGESFGLGDALPGAGIFRSTDSGDTWNVLLSTKVPNTLDFQFVNKIAVSPGTSTRLYAATGTGLYRSTDRGLSWTRLLTGDFREVAVRTPSSADVVLAFSEATGVRRSVDSGGTFEDPTGLPAGMGRATIAFNTNSFNQGAWVSFSTTGGTFGGLFLSVDDGATFVRRDLLGTSDQAKANQRLLNDAHQLLDLFGGSTIDCPTPVDASVVGSGMFAMALGINPALGSTDVWLGGVDLWRSNDNGRAFGPASYSWLPSNTSPFAPADQHAILFNPGYNAGTNRTILFAGDGGIYRTTDGEAAVVPVESNDQVICRTAGALPAVSFESLNHGYGATQFNGGGVSATGNVFIGATEDTGLVRFDTGSPVQDWTQLNRGLGGAVAVDSGDPNLIYATGFFSSPTTFGDFYRSVDGGASFTRSISGIDDGGFFFSYVPLGVDPSAAQTLWFGGCRPHRSQTGGANWTPASFVRKLTNSPITAWAIAPSGAGQIVYLATSTGEVWCSRNALAAVPDWANIEFDSGGLPNQFIGALAVDPVNPNKLFVGFATPGINGGQLWVCDDTRNLGPFLPSVGVVDKIPNVPINSILIHPREPRLMFVGTDLGVLASSDFAQAWSNISNASLANTRISQLALQGNGKLFAFTHGRGVYSTQVSVPLMTLSTPDGGERFLPGSTHTVTWTASEGADAFANIDHFDLQFALDGSLFNQVIVSGLPASERSFDWTVPSGVRTTFARVRVQARDASNALLDDDASDNTFTINGLPDANAGPAQIVLPISLVQLSGTSSTDPDADVLTYNWTQLSPASPVAGINTVLAQPTFVAPPTRGILFQFSLVVSDSLEEDAALTTVRVNRVPLASAGPDRRPIPGSQVTLTGSGSSDPDGSSLTYQWSQLTGPGVTFAPTTANTTFTAPPTRGTIMDFQVQTLDSLESATDTVRVTVNRLPVAQAGAPQRVIAGSPVTLSGSASSDPDSDPVTYAWVRTAGPVVSFSPTQPNPTFTAPLQQGAAILFRLTLSDGVETSTANTTVTVNQKPVPTITAPAVVLKSALVTLTGSGSSDGDGEALAYTWTQLSGTPVNFNGSTANPTFTAPAVSGLLQFRLSVTDALEPATAQATVGVNSLPVPGAGPDLSVPPAATVSLDARSSVDPDADALTYAWTQTSGRTVTLTGAASALASFTAPVTRGDVMGFRLSLADGIQTATDDTVVRVNRLPVPNPTAPAAVKPGARVTLTGSGSSDPDLDPLSFLWSQTSGPPVTFATTTANTSFTAPAARGAQLTFALRASDGVESQTRSLSLRVNQLPRAAAERAEQAVAPGETCTLDATPSNDPDADPLTYRWTQVGGPPVTFVSDQARPTFATAGLARGEVLTFSCEVDDGVDTASLEATVRINQAPEPKVAERVTAVPSEAVKISANGSSDLDADPLKFRWKQTAGPAVTFDATSGTLSFTAPAVGKQSLAFEVEVSDGVETTTARVAVDLTDRTYESGLSPAGVAGGCNATRHGASGSPFGLAGIWLMTVFLACRKRRKILPD